VGLDASVYDRGHGPDDDDHDPSDHVAAMARLGNTMMIAHIRERAALLLPPGSITVSKVIYSGSHAGDALDLEHVPTLLDELKVLRADRDPHMKAFVASLAALAEAALREGNPICF